MSFEVFPAIDLRAGRVVRLYQGDYQRETIFADDPVAVARQWVALGARWLHLVDLDGAAAGTPRATRRPSAPSARPSPFLSSWVAACAARKPWRQRLRTGSTG
ncbi:MAG: hypothetical protein KatS3mg061_2611 [Dehalococcoidia bacterium]|nr:MAG: hypothetical protein KatS3mg061_2611 [Dehalococcoidia bacterium]